MLMSTPSALTISTARSMFFSFNMVSFSLGSLLTCPGRRDERLALPGPADLERPIGLEPQCVDHERRDHRGARDCTQSLLEHHAVAGVLDADPTPVPRSQLCTAHVLAHLLELHALRPVSY